MGQLEKRFKGLKRQSEALDGNLARFEAITLASRSDMTTQGKQRAHEALSEFESQIQEVHVLVRDLECSLAQNERPDVGVFSKSFHERIDTLEAKERMIKEQINKAINSLDELSMPLDSEHTLEL